MNTNTRIIFQRLQGVESEIEKLRNTLFALKTTDIEKYGANYEALSTDAALRSERITCQLRNLVYINDFSGKNSYLKLAADAQGISISQEQEYKDCVVCFSQIYDRTLSSQRVRDYDNLEFKQILDTIATYVLLDDTGLYCDSYHTTEFGNADSTVVYIMEKSAFPDWVKAHKELLETISEIS